MTDPASLRSSVRASIETLRPSRRCRARSSVGSRHHPGTAAPVVAQTSRRVVVLEESGGTIAGAQLLLRNASGVVLHQTTTDSDGSGTIGGLPLGRYWLEVSARNFQVHRSTVDLAAPDAPPVRIVLTLAGYQSNVTVTTERGMVADIERAWPVVTVATPTISAARPLATIGNALEGGAGIMAQQSTYGQVSPFLRGLTGYHVLNLIDGVRFNNSTFRSGPNQYLAFVDPAQAQRIEAMLGPASSQFGSDALGGAIQVLTPSPLLAGGAQRRAKVSGNLFAASGDESAGADATRRVRGKILHGVGRRIRPEAARPARRAGPGYPPRASAALWPVGRSDSRGHGRSAEGHGLHAIRLLREGDRPSRTPAESDVLVPAQRHGRCARLQGRVGRAWTLAFGLPAAGPATSSTRATRSSASASSIG